MSFCCAVGAKLSAHLVSFSVHCGEEMLSINLWNGKTQPDGEVSVSCIGAVATSGDPGLPAEFLFVSLQCELFEDGLSRVKAKMPSAVVALVVRPMDYGTSLGSVAHPMRSRSVVIAGLRW